MKVRTKLFQIFSECATSREMLTGNAQEELDIFYD